MTKENKVKLILGFLSTIFLIHIGATLFKNWQIDFTEERLYTLSEGTKSLLKRIDGPLKLKLFYSKTAANKGTEALRVFNNHFRYVEELLRQYQSYARNNIELEVIDPRPDTAEEEDAQGYGLKKFNLTQSETYFFGLVAINESGAEKIIEFFDPNQKDKLEYDLTKLIYSVLSPQKKTIGILSSLDVIGEEISPYMAQMMRMQGKLPQSSWTIVSQLKELYHVKKIEKDTDNIAAIDALVVIHPHGLQEKTLFAIDQYLLKGGKLLVLTDPHSIMDGQSSPDAGFNKLFHSWGIEQKANTFVGDKYLSGVGRFAMDQPPARLIGLLNCNAICYDGQNDILTSGLDNLTFLYPAPLTVTQKEKIKTQVLLQTTQKGNRYEAQNYELNNPVLLANKFSEGSQAVPFAYRLTGEFESAYPQSIEVEDPENTKKKIKKENITKSQKEGAIIVIADSNFITDQIAYKNTFLGPAIANNNSTLFLNAVEAIMGNTELMSVRAKGKVNRGFDVITQIELEAEQKTLAKVNEINANINRFQNELNKLSSSATQENLALIQTEGLLKRKELQKKIAELKKDLRAVKRQGREKVEDIGQFLMYLNTLFVPLLVIGLGVYKMRARQNLMLTRKTQQKQIQHSNEQMMEA